MSYDTYGPGAICAQKPAIGISHGCGEHMQNKHPLASKWKTGVWGKVKLVKAKGACDGAAARKPSRPIQNGVCPPSSLK
ncbi:hypothetical protein M2103_001946 [Ereboglobus sp. PH5-5]|nr:hypothetical protein [Ereboglobus sp. PH5-5]